MNTEQPENTEQPDSTERRELLRRFGVTGLSLAAALLAGASLADTGAGQTPTGPLAAPADPSLPPPPGARPRHDMSGYGIPDGPPQHIGMLLYPQMTTLDLIGPQQILASLGNVQMHLLSPTMDLVTSDSGVSIRPTTTFADCPNDLTALFVPGGSRGTLALMDDSKTLDFLAKKGAAARYVTSVCTGSLVLGAAGLLRGYNATSHWALRDLLASFGATPTKARVVEDRNRITGGGVTAGLDLGLLLAARLRNERMAQALQLVFEYDPQPPFHAGTPEQAPPAVTQMAWAMYAPLRDDMRAAAKRIAQTRKAST